MSRLGLLWISALCASLAGCASTPAEPQWLIEARGREAEPLASQTIGSQDRFFRASVPARLMAPVQVQDGVYHARLDVGADAPVDCWVYRESLDPASSLALLSDRTFEAIGENMGEVDYKQIDGMDAGALGSRPFLALDWMYRLRSGTSSQVGQVKHLVADAGVGSLYCQHNEVGYEETFRRVVGAFVEGIRYGGKSASQPYFSQISTMSIKGMRVGVEHTTLTRDRDGDTRVDVRTSLLLPVNRDTLQASDSFGVEFVEPDGDLINQVHVESTNGEVVTHLRLENQSDGNWQVEGTFQTKPLSAPIEAGAQPTSWLGEALALRRSLADEGIGSRISLRRWVPGADPSRLLDETLTIERQLNRERFGAKLVMAGLEADLVVDRRGSVASASIDMGAGSVDVERVYMGGQF